MLFRSPVQAQVSGAFEQIRQADQSVFFRPQGQSQTSFEIGRRLPEVLIKAPPEQSMQAAQSNAGGWMLRGLRLYDADKAVLHEAGRSQQLPSSLAPGARRMGAKTFPYAATPLLLADGRLLAIRDHQIMVFDGLDDTAPTVFAGQAESGFAGDGGPAARARLNRPGALAQASDGSIYVADTGNLRLRRIRPDGVIETVMGNGQAASRLRSEEHTSELQSR